MQLSYSGQTDVGRRREHNEDAFLLAPDDGLCVVADGLGGYAAGEVASSLTVQAVGDFYRAIREDGDLTWPCARDHGLTPEENLMRAAVILANERIRRAAVADPRYQGMGSTVVTACFRDGRCLLGHVGDSRCYRFRDGRLEQLTEDHSLWNAMRATLGPGVTEQQFPMRNVILRALGKDDSVKVDVRTVDARKGDVFLLCSDGLWGEVDDKAIEAAVGRSGADLDRLVAQLVRAACEHGGKDNITVAAVRVE